MQNTEYAVEGDLFYVRHFHLAGRENYLVRKNIKSRNPSQFSSCPSFCSCLPSVVIFSLLGFQQLHACFSTAYPQALQLMRHKGLAKLPLSNSATYPYHTGNFSIPFLHHWEQPPSSGTLGSINFQLVPLSRLSEKAPSVTRAAGFPHVGSCLFC